MPVRAMLACVLALLVLVPAPASEAKPRLDKKRIQKIAGRFFRARPKTRFERWKAADRKPLLEEAKAFGPLPEGGLGTALDLVWKTVKKNALKPKGSKIETPYGEAKWIQSGRGGRKSGLLIGLHGGGENAGDASEASGNWSMSGCMGMYPQGIRLVHDTWNAVHGEAFVLTLIELAKARYEIDPDRVYVAGFSMGGTGSWHMAGRHPDLFAGAIPAHGVIMAEPKSKLATKEEVKNIQFGLLPNVRNLPVYFYTGLVDKNCEPGTFLFAWDRILELKEEDPGGYGDVRFKAWPGLAHAFPPGEPQKGEKWIGEKRRMRFPETLVWEYASDPFPMPDEQDKVTRPSKQWFYWIRCKRPADGMTVTAVRKGNEIDLEIGIAFPEDVEIYLNPEMIDVEKDVVVRLEGKEVYRGKPVPDLVSILESLDAKLDRRMVFDRRIVLPETD